MDGGETEGPDKGEGDSEMPRSGLEHVEADVADEVVPVPAPTMNEVIAMTADEAEQQKREELR